MGICSGPIGVDLDNTIISYDRVLFDTALQLNLIGVQHQRGKKAIRDSVRKLPGGEIKWQKLQAAIYGPELSSAELMKGVDEFFLLCKEKSIPVFIVSHKTQFANYDVTNTDLRQTAIQWLKSHNFLDPEKIGLDPSKIFFESTREEKIDRIKDLGCKIFIDDLEETFMEPSFPDGVIKILFDCHNEYANHKKRILCNTWAGISDYIFGA